MSYRIKRGDRKPDYKATLRQKNETTGAMEAIPLGAAQQVKLLMKSSSGSMVVNSPMIVDDATGGKVRYEWDADDTTTAGTFSVEFEITWSTGIVQTIPNVGAYTVEIGADLG